METKPGPHVDIKYIGVPNICFSLTDPSDPRDIEYAQQRVSRGFDDSETWSLRDTIGNFALPRLIRYREIVIKTIVDHDGHFTYIDKAIRALELLVRDNGVFDLTPEEEVEYKEGMDALHGIFINLWW